MTLREQFRKEIEEKFKGNDLQILFNQSNQDYINWLEKRIISDGVSKQYAAECVKASLEKASESATFSKYKWATSNKEIVEINKESITNPENIILL